MENPFEEIISKLDQLEDKICALYTRLDVNGNNSEDAPLGMQEAAKFLRISIQTLYGLVSKREISYCKRNNRNIFYKKDLEEYIQRGRIPSKSEVKVNANSLLPLRSN